MHLLQNVMKKAPVSTKHQSDEESNSIGHDCMCSHWCSLCYIQHTGEATTRKSSSTADCQSAPGVLVKTLRLPS